MNGISKRISISRPGWRSIIPEKLFFIPYYTLSVLCAFTHLACAHYVRRKELASDAAGPDAGARFRKEALLIFGTGVVATALIMGSLTGLFYPL